MKVLVVGSGGREHALVWKFSKSNRVDQIFVAPGNAGTLELAENIDIKATEIDKLVQFAKENKIDLTFVGPEAPLVEGIVDAFERENLRVFGPNKEAAQLEGSKVFSKNLMKKYGIPTAKYETFSSSQEAITYIKKEGAPIVVKAEGLAAGKGVIVAQTVQEAVDAVETIMVDDKFGEAGAEIVVEEFLEGEEATILAFSDGKTVLPMIASQDHKPAYDRDEGPNTGGMGAYAPAPIVSDELSEQVYEEIILRTIEALNEEGINFKGILYTGLMIKDGEAKVLEYNARFGDPETQVVLPLLETDLVDIVEAVIDENLAEIEISWSDKKAVCVIMASGGYPIEYEKGKEISGLDIIDKRYQTTVFQAGTKKEKNKIVTDGGRILGITALGNEYQETIERAYQGVRKIDFEDAHYRTDIGAKAVSSKK